MAETMALAKQAIRLSPRDPLIGNWYFQIGAVHFLQSCTKEAIVRFEKARSANTVRPIVHAYLASAYALKGQRGGKRGVKGGSCLSVFGLTCSDPG